MTAISLIVNADDFGISEGVTDGIVRAHVDGVVTSTSLMVRGRAAIAAATAAHRHPSLDVGLHVDLGEWVHDGHRWELVDAVVDLTNGSAIAAEVDEQLARFVGLVGRPPTHIDSHQHVHREEPVRSVLQPRADALGVVLRGFGSEVAYRGDFYGQSGTGDAYPAGITLEGFRAIVGTLPPGVTELGCHPGFARGLISTYAAEREVELDILCHPLARRAIEEAGIELVAFADLRHRPPDDATAGSR